MNNMPKTSNWWYLLPIFFGIVGGLIMFFALRKEDNETAKTGIVLSVIITGVALIITVLFILRLPAIIPHV
jgi:hypothetical protein